MLAYIGVNGASAAAAASAASAKANPDNYSFVQGTPLVISAAGRGVIANDVNVYGVQLLAPPAGGLTLNADGTFTYTPSGAASDSFTYCANTPAAKVPSCAANLQATVTLTACTSGTGSCLSGNPTANDDAYVSNVASQIQVGAPGVLVNDKDPGGHPLQASAASNIVGGTVTLNPDGSFTAAPTTPPTANASATVTFKYTAVNSQNTPSTAATVTVTFNGGSGLKVTVYDAPSMQPGATPVAINDYRWIIEEDRTFHVDPFADQYRPGHARVSAPTSTPATCRSWRPAASARMPANPGRRCSATPRCATSATASAAPSASQQNPVDPSQVHLDPTKHYYISILPGDAGNSFTAGAGAPVPGTGNTAARAVQHRARLSVRAWWRGLRAGQRHLRPHHGWRAGRCRRRAA